MNRKIQSLVVLLLCTVILFCGCEVREPVSTEEKILTVHMLDVEDAECLFVQLPDGKTLLIDSGESWHADEIISYINSLGVSEIDTVLATHPHSDHIGGLPQIISTFEIGRIYLPDAVHTTKNYEQLLDLLETRNIPTYQAKAGVVMYDGAYTAKFLAPCSETYSNLNNYSAILKLEYKEKSFLFTGDAEKLVEKEVLKFYAEDLDCDVLKVCHHGAETSSSLEFLQAVSPEIALISAGGDQGKYENPDAEVIGRLQELGVKIYRTDLHGNLVIKTDGLNWRK